MKKNILLALALTTMLSSCSAMPDWLGGDDTDKDKIKGERIAVLGTVSVSDIEADPSLADKQVLIPRPTPNSSWYKSTGIHHLIPGNQPLALNLMVAEKALGGGTESGEHLTATPIIAENKVFVINARDTVSAFDINGVQKKPIWRTKLDIVKTKEQFSSAAGMTYSDGRIYVASGYNEVLAINVQDGNIIWRKTIDGIARSAPDAKDGKIFVNTANNRLYAFDAKDGGIIWTHSGGVEDISMFGSASPVAYEDVVIAPYSSGELYAINASDGTELWGNILSKKALGYSGSISDIDASPTISGDKLFVISNDGILAAVDIKTGKVVWNQQVSGRQSPWVAGDFLYVINSNGELVCVNIPTGGIQWVQQLPKYKKAKAKKGNVTWSGPVMAGDNLLVVGSEGKFMAISPRDGSVVYEKKVPDDIYLPPIVASGFVLLLSDDGELVKLLAK